MKGRAIGWGRGGCGSVVTRPWVEDGGSRDRFARANRFGGLLSRCRVCCSLVANIMS